MKKFNRLLSILLVVVMLAGLVTVTASAEVEALQAETPVLPEKFTVEYVINYGEPQPATIQVEKDTTIAASGNYASGQPAVSRDGYTLDGWYTTTDFTGTKWNFATDKVTGNVTLYAKWIKLYTVTFDSGVAAQTVKEGEKATKPADPTKEGFSFKGWKNGENAFEFDTAITGDITLTADWDAVPVEVVKYDVAYVINGGTPAPAAIKVENDTTIAASGNYASGQPAVSRDGYTLDGWYTTADFTGTKWNFATDKVTGNVTLYAKWTEVASEETKTEVEVKVEVDGKVISTVNTSDGKVSEPAAPTKEGYTFVGWYNKATNEKVDFTKAITAPITIVAKFEQIKATVSLSALADKKLILKDALPKNYNETFTAYVYVENKAPTFNGRPIVPGFGRPESNRPSYHPTYGYREYRNLTYKGTVSTSFAVMRKDISFKYSIFDYFRFPDYRWNSTMTNAFTGTGSIEFTEAGTYTVYIKEQAGKTRYMSYDSDFEKAIVKVTKLDDGTLKAEVTKKAVITNVYDKSANFDADANTSVTLTKVDSVDKTKVLQGAKFKLYQEGKYQDYEYYSTYTTDYSGEIEIYNLAPGDYYFIEVAAPVGYELDDSKIEFTVGKTAKTQDVELTVTNKKINVFTEEHFAYIQGYEDGTVRPQNNITRAEAATILFRLLDDSVRAANWDTSASYADVPAAAWYNNAVATLENMGVLEAGVNYRPNENITRAELVNMITKFYDMSGLDIEGVAITDVSGHVYETAIKQAAAMGWVKGYTDGSFNPDASITRAEAVTMINRVLERAVEERGMCAGMVTFPDNSSAAWYYEDIQEATNSHTYTRTTTLVTDYDFYYESWGSIQANRDWTALEASLSK